MLDDRAGGLVEVTDELPCGVCVHVVVERHLFAGEQFGVRHAVLVLFFNLRRGPGAGSRRSEIGEFVDASSAFLQIRNLRLAARPYLRSESIASDQTCLDF